MTRVKTGLQKLVSGDLDRYTGYRLGIVCNATSVNNQLIHSTCLIKENPRARLTAVFGPQHGIYGETQDNMVEWDSYHDPVLGLPVYSLYGQTRMPTEQMLNPVDAVLFDIQDIGARYYTFIYTMANVMTACAQHGKKVIVLDRPNPITGALMEGNILHRSYASFVGMYPILIRHGMTVGELANMFNRAFGISCDLDIIRMDGWTRGMWFDETELPWVIPSPNMPTLSTATVYPGMCLLEGTNLSEGRGTTRPFEIFGAPFIEPQKLTKLLNESRLPGVFFRPLRFRPTFQKWKGTICGGAQIHVTDRSIFKPVLTAVAILRYIRELYSDTFHWRLPPYEYEYEKLPFDILAGTSNLRRMIDEGAELKAITDELFAPEETRFLEKRKEFLLYD